MIWIVEDDPKIAMLIEMTVKKAGHETLRLPDAEALDRQLLRGELPHLMLLDLMLRAKSGFTVMKEWKERPATRDIPVIILSARSAEHDKVTGLELGAEDYITKTVGVRELQARVMTALRRKPAPAREIAVGGIRLFPETREVYVDGARVDLTQKEFELLAYLARFAGQTVTRGTLLREVWGYASEEDPSRTVDSHIKTLRLRLGDSVSEPRYVQTIRGTGYRLIAGERA